eukprot:8859740-Pyramimonas_sp.AAC.1
MADALDDWKGEKRGQGDFKARGGPGGAQPEERDQCCPRQIVDEVARVEAQLDVCAIPEVAPCLPI